MRLTWQDLAAICGIVAALTGATTGATWWQINLLTNRVSDIAKIVNGNEGRLALIEADIRRRPEAVSSTTNDLVNALESRIGSIEGRSATQAKTLRRIETSVKAQTKVLRKIDERLNPGNTPQK